MKILQMIKVQTNVERIKEYLSSHEFPRTNTIPMPLPAKHFLFILVDKTSNQLCYMTVMYLKQTLWKHVFEKLEVCYMNHLTTLIFFILQLKGCLATFYAKYSFIDSQVFGVRYFFTINL